MSLPAPRRVLAEASSRMAAPLMAMDAAESMRLGEPLCRPHLHMITFVAQCGTQDPGLGPRDAAYDFSQGAYMPHSALLDHDMSGSQDLAECDERSPFIPAGGYSSACRITGPGRRRLKSIRAGMGREALDSLERRISDACSDMPVALLEGTCGKFRPRDGLSALESRSRSGLAAALPRIRLAYEKSGHMRAVFAAAMVERLGAIASVASGRGHLQRRVVALMSLEITRECADLVGRAAPPAGAALLDPRLAYAGDLMLSLTRYCEKEGMAADPADRSMEDVFGSEDARRLWETLRDRPIPS